LLVSKVREVASQVATALTYLPNLTSLELSGSTPLRLVTSALTQLTRLELHPSQPPLNPFYDLVVDELVADLEFIAAQLSPQLHTLTLTVMDKTWTPAKRVISKWPDIIKTCLMRCPGLRAFETGNAGESRLLDTLLSHGRHLQNVTLGSLEHIRSIPTDIECPWDNLTLLNQGPDWPDAWYFLPRQIASICTPLPTYLSLPITPAPEDSVTCLSKAAANLAAGMEKQGIRKHPITLSLFQHVTEQPPLTKHFEALAPLDGFITSLHLSAATGPRAAMGSKEVAALGQGLGQGLAHLTLSNCHLDSSFWSSLIGSLPSLLVCKLGAGMEGAVSAEEISCMVTAGHSHSLQLQLSKDQFDDAPASRITQKVQGVTVQLYGGHMCVGPCSHTSGHAVLSM
jgi:hypothetical protein